MGNTDDQSRLRVRFAAVLIGLTMLRMIGGCSRPPECFGAEPTVGIALPLDGVTEFNNNGQTVWQRLAEATCLEVGDAVRTLGGGSAAVFFADGSRILLAPDTEVSVVVYSLGAEYRIARLALGRGTLTYDVGSLEFPISVFQVISEFAVLTVTGTTGQFEIDPDLQIARSVLLDGEPTDVILAGPTISSTGHTDLIFIESVPGVQIELNTSEVEAMLRKPLVDMAAFRSCFRSTEPEIDLAEPGVSTYGLAGGGQESLYDSISDPASRSEILDGMLAGMNITIQDFDLSVASEHPEQLVADIMSRLLSAVSDPEIDPDPGIEVVYIRQTDETEVSDSGRENPYGYQLEATSGISIAEAEVSADEDAERLLEINPPWDFGLEFSTAPVITPPGGFRLPTLVESTPGGKQEDTSVSSPASPCPQLNEGGCEAGRHTPTPADSLRATPSPTGGATTGSTPGPSATATSTPCQSLMPGGCVTATPK